MNRNNQKGFALPTILIASIVMLTVLIASVVSTAAMSGSIMRQSYEKLTQDASIAGKLYADKCIEENLGVPWTNPLTPGTDCIGNQLATCPADDPCNFLSIGEGINTTFSVEVTELDPSGSVLNVSSNGVVNLLRSSDDGVWRTYNKSMTKSDSDLKISDLTFKEISGGYYHTCGIASDNKAYCWGLNSSGQLGDNTKTRSFIPRAVNTDGLLNGKTFKSIAPGAHHTCAIASDNKAYCWGVGSEGQLGDNTTVANSLVPVAVNTAGHLSGKTIKSIASGFGFSCAIASDNQVYCWGFNEVGQLGDDSTINRSTPVPINTSGVLSGKTIKSISAKDAHVCAIASDDRAYCWGNNDYGRLGNNSLVDSSVPVSVDISGVLLGKTIKSIAAGVSHTCAVASDNQAYCWGNNGAGSLGDGSNVGSLVPVAVDKSGVLSGKDINSISASYLGSCAVASDNQAYCWGFNLEGQLGNNSFDAGSNIPVAVDRSGVLSGKTIRFVHGGFAHICAIASDHGVYCWGRNDLNQLGNNSTANSPVPVQTVSAGTMRGLTFRELSSRGSNSCAIGSDNQAYCWGENTYGQLGNGTTENKSVPTAVDNSGVLINKTIVSISSGDFHTCAIASDNLAYCWGRNQYGQLGNNSNTQSEEPVAVNTSGVLLGKTIRSIKVGFYRTCAIASDNQAYCWGENSANGSLGNNSTINSSVPVQVYVSGFLSGKTINDISMGHYHSCVIASDNQVYCWGYGVYGQLGDSSNSNSLVPVPVDNSGVLLGETAISLSLGYLHTCIVASDNLAYCWGNNDYGILGNGLTVSSNIPVSVTTSGLLSGKTVSSISAHSNHTCIVASDNYSYCWGSNNGKFGDGTGTNSLLPVMADYSGALSGISADYIFAGYVHTCILASNNQAYCWGANSAGQLGSGNLDWYFVPHMVNTYSINR